jgi:PAS domain S-box-containing protein
MPMRGNLHAVDSVEDTADYQLDDIEWLEHELAKARPGNESRLMRLLLSRVTLNNMFQFCALLDAQGTMWDVNHAALRGAGITRTDIHGKPFWEARWWQTSAESREQLKTAIERAAQGEFVRYDVDIIGRASGNEIITIDFDIAPVTDRDGTIRFLICEGRDVTEQRRLESEVRRQKEELAKLDELKTQFFANVSHEFRTPLTLILGPVADALADAEEPLRPRQRERVALVQRNGLRLLKLVNTLLDFSRIEAGRVQAVYEPTNLATFTADLASSFRAAMEKAGLRFIVDCRPLPEPVYVDRDMWEKIVLNLLSNAFKFTLEGEVEAKLRATEGMAELSVRDTGTGIPEHELPHIFDRFHRVEGSRGRSHEGSGIGLALVQELTKLHGGSIRAESALSKGSLFVVSLPFGSMHLPAERVGASPSLSSTSTGATAYVEEVLRWLPGQETILPSGPGPQQQRTDGEVLRTAPASPDGRHSRVVIADDNADMRDYLRRLLSEAGYAVEAVADGQEALRAVCRDPPDLVLSDVMMPELDGFALLKGIRADPLTTAVPVLLLSARAGEEASVEGLEAGADDYLIKPFAARELLARVAANIALARLRRDAAKREQELRRQIEDILDRISDAFYAVDRELRVVYANRRLEELIQQPREELIGQRIADIFPNAWEGDWESYRRRFAAVGDALAARFESFSEALGAWIEGTIYRSDTGYSVYLQDVSGRRRIEEELRKVTGQAEAAALASTNLLAAASRDLRQPLDVIIHDVLQVAAQNSEHRQMLSQAQRAAGRLASALDKLTELAQLVSGAREPQRRTFLIREIFEQIRQSWVPAASERQIDFELSQSEELVHSDPQMLTIMLNHLVGNAIGFTERGRVWVECRRRDDMLAIEVHDTGIGIPEHKLDDIFKEFHQLHPSHSEGMGLGLAIVRRMADLLGHQIAVRSAPGEGSCFQIEVPMGSWRHVIHSSH